VLADLARLPDSARASPSLCRSACGSVSRLQEHDPTLTPVGADADDPVPLRSAVRQFFYGLTQDSRPRCTKRVTERDAAAVRIHSLAWEGAQGGFDTGLAAHEVHALERFDVEENVGGLAKSQFGARVELDDI